LHLISIGHAPLFLIWKYFSLYSIINIKMKETKNSSMCSCSMLPRYSLYGTIVPCIPLLLYNIKIKEQKTHQCARNICI
jgi:hypothetical protein